MDTEDLVICYHILEHMLEKDELGELLDMNEKIKNRIERVRDNIETKLGTDQIGKATRRIRAESSANVYVLNAYRSR